MESELAKLRKQKNRKAKKLAEKESVEIQTRGYLSLSRWLQRKYDCGSNDTWAYRRPICYRALDDAEITAKFNLVRERTCHGSRARRGSAARSEKISESSRV